MGMWTDYVVFKDFRLFNYLLLVNHRGVYIYSMKNFIKYKMPMSFFTSYFFVDTILYDKPRIKIPVRILASIFPNVI